MGKAWYIKLKRRIRGFDPDEDSPCPDHPAVGRWVKKLDVLSGIHGWKPLASFVSEDPDIAIDLLDEEDEDEVEEILRRIGKVRWFKAKDALATVKIMAQCLEEIPRRLPLTPKNVAKIVAELKDLQRTLERAAENDVPFRFYAEFG